MKSRQNAIVITTLLHRYKYLSINIFLNIEKERLQPFDLDVLSSHLRRLATDHQELAVQLEHVLREKACLQEQRDKSTEKCKEKENRIRTLEQQLCDAEACAVEARDMAMKEIHIVLQKNHHAEWDRAQTDSYIMQLQMKLLTANEEVHFSTLERLVFRLRLSVLIYFKDFSYKCS